MGFQDPFFSGLDLQILVTLVLVALSWFLHARILRRAFFRWWVWGWAALAGAALLLRLYESSGLGAGILALNVPLGLLQATFFAFSAETLRRREPLSAREVRVGIAGTVAVGVGLGLLPAFLEGDPGLVRAVQGGPRHLALAFVFPGWAFIFGRREDRSLAVRLTMAGFVVLGLNQVLYATGALGRISLEVVGVGFTGVGAYVTSPWAFLLDIAGQVTVSLGAILLLVEGGVRAERKAGDLRRRLGGLVEHSSDFIAFGTGRDGMEFINGAGLRMVGLSGEDHRGRSMFEFLHPSVRESFQEEVGHTLVEEGTWEGETRLRRFDDDRPVAVDASIFLIREPRSGRPLATATICRDIREQKERERELRAAKEMAEAANQAKSDFLATMSHEIRTPLNAIVGMSELLDETDLDARQKDYVQVFRTASDTLLKLINEVLDLSKIEAGRLELDETGFDLRELVDQTVEVFAVPAHSKGIEIAGHVAPEVPSAVVGDPDRLRQVLVNLVGNAVKFTDEGEVVLDVRPAGPITDEAEVLELCFEVRDTGPGIPETQLEEIFERFRQADSSSTRKHGGTGLGLAISAALVDLMGGRLGVESTEGRGSTFRFNALFSRGDEDGSAEAPAPEDVTGVRVLVVDDNGTNRLILTEMLEGWGARPRAVADGDTGLELLRRAREAGDPFGLILLDGHMPGKDGFQVAEEIRQDPSLGRSTIMMLTSAGSRKAELQRAHELGIERYMVKPIRRSQLLEAIRKSLGSNRAAGETPPPEAAPEDSGAGRRILLVEDAEENRMLIRAYLKRTSHELHEVANGEEAVEAVTADPDGWDLVLMDVQMPVMDGYEATRRIRAWEEERGRDRLPIAALTAHALRSERKKSAEAGCDEHVTKPIKKKELLETITRLTPDGALRRPEEVTP